MEVSCGRAPLCSSLPHSRSLHTLSLTVYPTTLASQSSSLATHHVSQHAERALVARVACPCDYRKVFHRFLCYRPTLTLQLCCKRYLPLVLPLLLGRAIFSGSVTQMPSSFSSKYPISRFLGVTMRLWMVSPPLSTLQRVLLHPKILKQFQTPSKHTSTFATPRHKQTRMYKKSGESFSRVRAGQSSIRSPRLRRNLFTMRLHPRRLPILAHLRIERPDDL